MIQPCDDYILIDPDELPDETEGGVIIPANAKVHRNKLTMRGTVIAVGPGRMLRNGVRAPVDCKPGDRVLFEQFEGYEHMFELDPEKFGGAAKRKLRLIREAALLGVMPEDKPARTWQDERAERRSQEWPP